MKIHHIGISVRNLDVSISFYQSFLGLYPSLSFTFMDERLVFMEGDGMRLELVATNEDVGQTSTHIAIQIDNLIDWMNQLQYKGYYPVDGPFKLENGWETVFYQGPDHEIIEFIQV